MKKINKKDVMGDFKAPEVQQGVGSFLFKNFGGMGKCKCLRQGDSIHFLLGSKGKQLKCFSDLGTAAKARNSQ